MHPKLERVNNTKTCIYSIRQNCKHVCGAKEKVSGVLIFLSLFRFEHFPVIVHLSRLGAMPSVRSNLSSAMHATDVLNVEKLKYWPGCHSMCLLIRVCIESTSPFSLQFSLHFFFHIKTDFFSVIPLCVCTAFFVVECTRITKVLLFYFVYFRFYHCRSILTAILHMFRFFFRLHFFLSLGPSLVDVVAVEYGVFFFFSNHVQWVWGRTTARDSTSKSSKCHRTTEQNHQQHIITALNWRWYATSGR